METNVGLLLELFKSGKTMAPALQEGVSMGLAQHQSLGFLTQPGQLRAPHYFLLTRQTFGIGASLRLASAIPLPSRYGAEAENSFPSRWQRICTTCRPE